MKKVISIFLLLLISLTSLSGNIAACDFGYELTAENEESENKNKNKNEKDKEFTLTGHRRILVLSLLRQRYNGHTINFFTHPAIAKPTPPPDPFC